MEENMARKKASKDKKAETNDFTASLIKSLNKEHGSRVAYNLAVDTSPTHVNRWIGTGSKQLDILLLVAQMVGCLKEEL